MTSNERQFTQEEARGTAEREATRGGRFFRPPMDIFETPDELKVQADVPGSTLSGISVDFHDGVLTIHASARPRQPEGMRYLLHEFAVGDFHRAFEVNEDISHDKITADYANGVLTIRMPKAETAKPRKIQVQSGK